MTADAPVIGVLAMQGAFADHARVLERLGARARLVRSAADLEGLDGLVLPGGESTSMQILLERMGLWEPVRRLVLEGMPTLGTCAGMILLSHHITDGREGQRSFDALPITVRRNGYGRQVASFETPLQIEGLGADFPGVFIRAPLVEDAGGAEVLSTLDGHPVAVRQGRVMALGFHPELSGDDRLHRVFLELVASAGETVAAGEQRSA
ncbi:MAG: pyridoxal 5'-phosphate synthase glutaminase subunit PdxT [Candidatus Dormibacteraeota bacterium]|nr:pyridoxal 5'-phosphate synthase glutaminase subunit PdxT [Candidatus Dormibacteraeota bacterium]MBO0743945.1 pyridoxal 5'-phosphate synthase glutaminase subunit PdxT [Candidatus Dormibacteraeota bacterium]